MTGVAIANWTLGPLLGLMTLLFIFRIVLTWYPETELNKFPFNVLYWLTEPLLAPVRRVVPSFGGIDVSPIIWVGLVTLLREILVGQQGLLRMLG